MTDHISSIDSALHKGVVDCDLGLPTAVANSPFDKPPGGAPWAAVHVLPNPTRPATLGDGGEDAHDGIMQIDLNYAPGTGRAEVLSKAGEVASFFKAGTRLQHGGVTVTVASCSRSRGREVDGWYRVSMTVAWYARTPRN